MSLASKLYNSTYQTLGSMTSKTPGLKPSLSAMLTCVALAAANHPNGVPIVVNQYLNKVETVKEKIEWLEYARNGMFKSIVLTGTPRVINAQTALYDSLPKEYQALLRKRPLNEKRNTKLWNARGMDFFDQVYGDNSSDTKEYLNNSNPDLWYWVDEIYGNVISDTTYLDYKETQSQVIVSLIQMDALPQLPDHLQGVERVGATFEQIKAAEFIGHRVKDALSLQ